MGKVLLAKYDIAQWRLDNGGDGGNRAVFGTPVRIPNINESVRLYKLSRLTIG